MFVSEHSSPTKSIPPITLWLFDGSSNSTITYMISIPIQFLTGESFDIDFYVTPLDHLCSAVLGYNWLTRYNLLIDWYWAVLLSEHLFTQVLTLTWCQLWLWHLQCLHQLRPLILQSILLNLQIPWNLKSPSWMLWLSLEHAKRKGLKASKSISLTPTPSLGDLPKNLILQWTFPPSLWSIMTMLMSSANPRVTPYLLIGLMTSRSILRRKHLHLLVQSIPSLQQNSLHSVNSSMSTSSPVSSILQILLTELWSFSSKRKMDNSGYVLTSVVSIGSRRKTITCFCLLLTCWTLLGKPVCIQRSTSDMLATLSALPKVTNQKLPSGPATDLTSGV